MCFSLKCCDFSELCKFCYSACVWPLPLCTLTDIEGKPKESGIYFKIFEKTQYLINTLYFKRYCIYSTKKYEVNTGSSKIISRSMKYNNPWITQTIDLATIFEYPVLAYYLEREDKHYWLLWRPSNRTIIYSTLY